MGRRPGGPCASAALTDFEPAVPVPTLPLASASRPAAQELLIAALELTPVGHRHAEATKCGYAPTRPLVSRWRATARTDLSAAERGSRAASHAAIWSGPTTFSCL